MMLKERCYFLDVKKRAIRILEKSLQCFNPKIKFNMQAMTN